VARDTFNGDYVGVLRQLAGPTSRASAAQRQQALRLLRRLVASPETTDKTRDKAARAIAAARR
jgi:hypothetical protein